MEHTLPVSRRHHGLDLLRLVATGMIILHHLISHGGLMQLFPSLCRSDILYQSINIICYCAVNLYGLITGYVEVGKRFRLSRLMELWMQVAATGLAITAAFTLFSDANPTAGDWLAAVTPLFSDSYWYFTAYFGMYLMLPMLHRMLNGLDHRRYRLLLLTGFVLFTVLPLSPRQSSFRLQYGYHILWLIVLYATGYYFRRFGFGRIGRYAPLVYIGCTAAAMLSRILIEKMILRGVTVLHPAWLEQYNTPTMYLGSCALLALFSRIRLGERSARIVEALCPMTFGVYLIHVHPLVFDRLIYRFFEHRGGMNGLALLLLLLAMGLGIYVACLALDWVRIRLFRFLRLHVLMEKTEGVLHRLMERLMPEEG
ncbi:MAG: acyltransferase [Clostridia bacterium]|nr:acyltransferase [Clostridia bacterium]